MLKAWLNQADGKLFDWLMAHPSEVPARFQKWLAWHYPDARLRKRYWAELNVTMGEGTYPNPGLLVVNTADADAKVTIGRYVSIAPGVILVTDSSPSNSPVLMNNPLVGERLIRRAPIEIEDDCWLGAGVIILPGVKIGRAAVIGAGAVVTRDVAAGDVVAGVPARAIRNIWPEQGAVL